VDSSCGLLVKTLEVDALIELATPLFVLKTDVDKCAPTMVFSSVSQNFWRDFRVDNEGVSTARVNNVWIAPELLFY
jgi:hypothetical protein